MWLIVTDEVGRADEYFDHFQPLRDAIHQSLQAHGVDRWLYLHFRTLGEQRELLAGEWE